MKKTLIIIGIITTVFLLIGLIGGLYGLSGFFYFLAYISIFAIIMGLGALGSEKGAILLIGSIIMCFSSFKMGSFLDKEAKQREENARCIEIVQNPTINKCKDFYRKYLSNENQDTIRKTWYKLLSDSCNTSTALMDILQDTLRKMLVQMEDFQEICKDTKEGTAMGERLNFICDSLYDITKRKHSFDYLYKFQYVLPYSKSSDFKEKILELSEAIEAENWETEPKAWQRASELDTRESFEKYLDKYPNGANKQCAIDSAVSKIIGGNHGTLPQMDRTGYYNAYHTSINIKNSTSYELTVMYSGQESKRVVLSPHDRTNVSLTNGFYRIAASVSASGVTPFAGSENLDGTSCDVEYYIETRRW